MKYLTRYSAAVPAPVLALILAYALLPAQTIGQASPPAGKSPAFKSNSRLVLVDVVVTDDSGQSVHGLKLQDFTVTENGKQQHITSFQEQRPDAQAKPAPLALNLPKNVYTNFVSRTDTGALTVLLFDSLNTDRQSLTYAKQEMLDFLKKLPPGKRVAMFTLSNSCGWCRALPKIRMA